MAFSGAHRYHEVVRGVRLAASLDPALRRIRHSGYIWATPPFLCGAAGGPRAPVGGLLGPGAACPGENSPPFL